MAKTGEVRLRNIEWGNGEKCVAVEVRGKGSKEWGLDSAYHLRTAQVGKNGEISSPVIHCGIAEKINYLLDLGYELVCCREHEWELVDGVPTTIEPKKAHNKADKGEER